MLQVLYFHGFASSPGSEKVGLLRERLDPRKVRLEVPDLNVPSFSMLDWSAMVARGLDAGRRISPDLVVGSSLGSLVALAVVKGGIEAPIVMIAPALGVAHRWIASLPDGDPVLVYHHATGREEPIHRRFFAQMATLQIDREPPAQPVTAIMGRLDDSVPFGMVRQTWLNWETSGRLAAGSRFIEVPNGDHGLTAHADLIASEVKRRLGMAVARGIDPTRSSP